MWEPQGLYSKFILKQPTILFGENGIRGLRNFPCSRVAVIHGNGLTDSVKMNLISSFDVFDICFIHKTWKDEPILDELQDTINAIENFRPDLIVAIGGGSVIDGSKLVRLFYEFPFFDIANPKFLHLEWSTKFVAIPSTIGSGSEISSAAVLFNKNQKSKEMIVSHSLIPDIVVLSPLLINESPRNLIVFSALDALSHMIEGYISNIDNPLVDIYAEKGCQIIYETFSTENLDFDNAQLNRLQYAGYFGGIVQNHCLVGCSHAIAHQLTHFGFGHSLAISLLLAPVIKLNSVQQDIKERYDLLALRSGIPNGIIGLLDLIQRMIDIVNLEHDYSKLRKIVPNLIDDSKFIVNVQNDKGGKANPHPITDEFIIDILNMI